MRPRAVAIGWSEQVVGFAGSGASAGVGCALSLENDPRTPPPLPPDVDDRIQVTSTGR